MRNLIDGNSNRMHRMDTTTLFPIEAVPSSVRRSDEAFQRLDQQLCFALYSSSLVMTKLYKPVLSALGLTYPQYLVLLVLWERDGLSVGELGERLFLDSGTLTPVLKRMQAAGWIRRDRSARDERRVTLTLTAAGQALRRQAQHVPHTVACAVGGGLDEVVALTARLQILRSKLAAQLAAASSSPPTKEDPHEA